MLRVIGAAAWTVMRFFLALAMVAFSPWLFLFLLVWVRVLGKPAPTFSWLGDEP